MTMPQNFRSAFNGFNREDVVHYIEYINSRHNTEVNQLKSELDMLRTQQQESPDVSALEEELAALRIERDELLVKIAQLEEQVTAPAPAAPTAAFSAEQELETYRRAERTERLARERADQLYRLTNGVLADAAVKVDGVMEEVATIADRVMEQLSLLQSAVGSSKNALQEATDIMYTLRPDNREL